VTVDWNGDEVSVFPGDGQGGFGPRTSYGVGGVHPRAAVLADFDASGNDDLLVAGEGSGTVTLLPGDGLGAFGTPVTLFSDAGADPYRLVTGQFNETTDSFLDVAFVTRAGGEMTLLLGDGIGGVTPGGSVAVGSLPEAIVAADFDGDTLVDLIVANWGSSDLTFLTGDGLGGFSEFAVFSLPGGPNHLVAADLDQNGTMDLVAADRDQDSVWVMLGDGAGVFSQPLGYPAGDGPVALTVADLDLDGNLDIAAADQNGIALATLLGDGTGVFGAPALFGAGVGPTAVASADLDDDGFPDLAAANGIDNSLTVVLNDTPHLECRKGTVNSAIGAVDDVIFVNGATGDALRRISAAVLDPLSLSVATPPAGPVPARYALYVFRKLTPEYPTVAPQPYRLGSLCVPGLFNNGVEVIVLANNIGKVPYLGDPREASTPAPSNIEFPDGYHHPITVTIQGFIEDNGSVSPKGFSTTNAIVFQVVP
jgi:hypothetical protein